MIVWHRDIFYLYQPISTTTQNQIAMTQYTVKNQIDAIHKATAQATKSRESALHFLTKSGIIQNLPKVNSTTPVSKKK